MLEASDFSIITQYQQVYRGIVQYYLMAFDVSKFSKLHWVMARSLIKTLAAKHQTSTSEILRQLKTTIRTPKGNEMVCLEMRLAREGKAPLVARFGGIPLKRQPEAVLNDAPYVRRRDARSC